MIVVRPHLACICILLILLAIFIAFVAFFFCGFGYRVVDMYHVFGWNERFGRIGEVLTVVLGILGLLVFWIVAAFMTGGAPVRYAEFFTLPVMFSFPVAFILTPFGHQSILICLVKFLTWLVVLFILIFAGVIGFRKYGTSINRKKRASLKSMPLRENDVSQQFLSKLKKYRSGLEEFLEKCKKYGSLDIFMRSSEYQKKYETYVEEHEILDENTLFHCDVDIAIFEYLLKKDVAKFRKDLGVTYGARWETRTYKVDNHSSGNFFRIVEDIFHSLAVVDLKQTIIQAEFLSESVKGLYAPLPLQEESIYLAIVAAAKCDFDRLQNACERLKEGQGFFHRLFEDPPEYWLLYLTGLAEKNVDLCNQGIRFYAEEHYYRILQNSEIEYYMCVQAIGMANLCRIHGLDVAAIPPIIPKDLLLPIEKPSRKRTR